MSSGKNRQMWRCHSCNKTAYGSSSRAMQAVDVLSTVSVRTKKPKRAYPCPHGNGWHMTSQEAHTR